jgi:DNA invertase Pin-like site-specific DNA recombinase
MRVIVAARLSQTSAGQTGIDTQDQDAEAWAQREGHDIVATVADHKSGAADWQARPNLRPWLTEPAKLVQYQGIVAASQDRLSRGKWRDEIAIRTWAEDNGKELFIVDTQLHWPPRDMGEQLRWEIDATRARGEWEKTSKRYSRMQAYLRANDYLVGRPPYGFRVMTMGNHKTLEPDPIKGPIVREMVARYLHGETLRGLAVWLEASGAPAPSKVGTWAPKSVNDVLRSTSLIGRRKDGNGKVILRFEPILANDDGTADMATWRQLQELLDANARRRGRIRNDAAMLTGALFCGKCGRIMHARRHTKTHKDGSTYTWHGYRCDGTPKDPSTCSLMVPMAETDAEVSDTVMSYGSVPHIVTEYVKGHNHEDELEENAADIAALDPDDDNYDAELARLRAERKRLRSLPPVADKVDTKFSDKTIGELWPTLDRAGKREYLLEIGLRFRCNGRLDDGTPQVEPIPSERFASLFTLLAALAGLPSAAAAREEFETKPVRELLTETAERLGVPAAELRKQLAALESDQP